MTFGSSGGDYPGLSNRVALATGVHLLMGLTLLLVATAPAIDVIKTITHLSVAYFFLITLALVHSYSATHDGGSLLFIFQAALVFVLGSLATILLLFGGLDSRLFELGAVFVCTLLLILARKDLPGFSTQGAPYIVAFATLFAIFLVHSSEYALSSGFGRFPVFAGIILGLNLFVIPRYVSVDAVYWSISLIAGGVALLALPTMVIGDYTIYAFEVRTWTATLPIGDVPVSRSIYANPNTFGLVMFPGIITSLVAIHRTYTLSRYPTLAFIPVLCLLLSAAGIVLSYSRAAMLAAAISCFLYIAINRTGSDGIPLFITGTVITVCLFLLAIFLDILPIDPGNRFTIWRTGLRTLLAEGSPFGPGLVSTSELMEPYSPADTDIGSVHNSYLSVVLRTGFIGGLAYLVLVVGPLLHSISRPAASIRAVGMLALASGFAVHQLFEAYTLYQFGPGSILGALAVGYVIESLTGPPHNQPNQPVSDLTVP